MTDITIPAAALEAGARAIYFTFTEFNIGDGEDYWERLLPRYRAEYRAQARAAFLAMLAAWEGAKTLRDDGRRQTYAIPAIILPLTQEASDDKA